MNKIAVNIPVEITIYEGNLSNISLSDSVDFNVLYDNKNYTECVKFIINNILSKFNNVSECDCKRNIQDLISKNIQEVNDKEKEVEKKYNMEIEKHIQNAEILKQEYESKLNILERKYEVELENKSKQYLMLEESINDKICSKYGDKEKEYILTLEKKEGEIAMLNYKLEQEYLNNKSKEIIASDLGVIKSDIQRFFKYDKNELGAQGETFIYEYIKQYLLLTDATVEKVNGESNACDIYLSYGNIKCGIESKNHTGAIRSDAIQRFVTTDIINPRYNCGIFISIKSEFVNVANIKHFDIKFYGSKPVIFLSEIIKKPEQIMIAIKILEFIISNNSKSENEIKTIIQTIQNYIPNLEKLQRNNKQIMKIVKESDKDIEGIINYIYKLLSIVKPECNQKKNSKHKCEKCKTEFSKKTELNKHSKQCGILIS